MTGEHIALAISRPTASAFVEAIMQAEAGGISAVWTTVGGTNPDGVSMLAAAAARTHRIGLGTSIVPAYPRHPVVLATQALVLADLAPGRFRLGVGPSHRPIIEGMFGVPMGDPLLYMREYTAILRGLLWEGSSPFDGEYFHVNAQLPAGAKPPKTPILLSALRRKAFRQAGEIADGAISWVCPVHYLEGTALPALREGAEQAGRPAPPLEAHVPVAWTAGQEAARSAGREFLGRYSRLPFYAGMFADAGHPVTGAGTVSDDLVDDIVVWGEPDRIVRRLKEILASGMSEVLVTLLPIGDSTQQEREFAQAVTAA